MFSQSGALTVTASDDAPVWDVQVGGRIIEVQVDLKVAGSSSSVFTIYINGSSIGTVTLTSSDTSESDDLGGTEMAVPGDKVTVRCTTAGTGAKSASVQVRMKG